MKRILFLGITLLMLLPLPASGVENSNYVSIRSGLYTFTDGLKDATLDTGFAGEVAYGRYLHPNIILEIATAYYHDGVNKGYGNSIKAEPILLTLKAVYPLEPFEFYAGGGGGFYFTKFHGMVNGVVGDKSDNVYGAHAVAGIQYALSSRFFVGLEGKYIFTEKADFVVFRPRLDGYTYTAHFGFRF